MLHFCTSLLIVPNVLSIQLVLALWLPITASIVSQTQYINKSQNAIAENKINIELDLINDWLKCNKLSLIIGKSKYMIFHNPHKKVDYLHIKIENTYIEKVKEFDFLGLFINENLTWKALMNKIANKISKSMGSLNRL